VDPIPYELGLVCARLEFRPFARVSSGAMAVGALVMPDFPCVKAAKSAAGITGEDVPLSHSRRGQLSHRALPTLLNCSHHGTINARERIRTSAELNSERRSVAEHCHPAMASSRERYRVNEPTLKWIEVVRIITEGIFSSSRMAQIRTPLILVRYRPWEVIGCAHAVAPAGRWLSPRGTPRRLRYAEHEVRPLAAFLS
jgi:hypothetical protein